MDPNEFNERLRQLTPSQIEVLRCYLNGKSDDEIATMRSCAPETVRTHICHAKNKFECNRPEDMTDRESLIYLFIEHKGEWVGPKRREEVGLPRLEDPSGRPVDPNSYFYMERGVESKIKDEIKNGRLVRIKAHQSTGKTSLISKILKDIEQEDQMRMVNINLLEVDQKMFSDTQSLLQWFCRTVGHKLNLPNLLQHSWAEVKDIHSCTNYFEDYLLSQHDGSIVLVLDNLDRIFPAEQVAPDFLRLLRLWVDKPSSELWSKLRLIISHSTEVYVELPQSQSPFNVGLPIELTGFTQAEISVLANRHGLSWGIIQSEQLKQLTNGHPYLVRLALYKIADSKTSWEALFSCASTETGIYISHLRGLNENLKINSKLVQAYKKVIKSDTWVEVETSQTRLLSSLGLVQQKSNCVKPYCNLYKMYFERVL